MQTLLLQNSMLTDLFLQKYKLNFTLFTSLRSSLIYASLEHSIMLISVDFYVNNASFCVNGEECCKTVKIINSLVYVVF